MQQKAHSARTSSYLAGLLALALATGLAACGSQPAGPGTTHGSGTTQPAAPGARPSARASGSTGPTGATGSTGPSAPTAATAKVPAAAIRVTCPVLGPAGAAGQSVPGQPAQPIPQGFSPVAVVQCIEVRAMAPGGQATNVPKEVAVAGLGALMAAIRRPSAPPTPASRVVGCPVVARIVVPWLVLIGRDGQLIHPRVPVGQCGAPVPPLRATLNSLHWIELPGTLEPPPVN